MIRKKLPLSLSKLKEQYPELCNYTTEIYLDVENLKDANEIKEILETFKKKIKNVFAIIVKGQYNDKLYKKEEKGITAIKLKDKTRNYRIYCKEIYKEGKKVVLISPYHKKVQKNQQDEKIINILDKIKSYEYDF